ncbi:hypothetical protein ACJ41O_003828 [Fusarium nematophilum]
MCTTNIYTYLYPDGHREQYSQPTLCASSRHGQVCANNMVFQHPSQLVSYNESTYPYVTQLPPTPQYSPVPSSYRSGDESDRSRESSSSKSKKRSSGVYINGKKVLDLNRRERDHGSSRRERIVVVDSPPTPRTPPQSWTAPHTAPASPNANTYTRDISPRDASRRHPVIVDERNRHVEIEVVDSPPRSKHSRHASTSSRDSRHSEEEEERRRRRREEKRIEDQQLRLRLRIAEANAEIAGRPVVPVPPKPRRASSTYKRPSVEVPDREAELVEAVRRMNFEEERREEKARRLARKEEKQAKKEEKKEEEAQRQRLMERMQPKRRATVGPGSRRHRVLYDDGVYRWE